MRRILPAITLAGLASVACASTHPNARPAVLPTSDPGLYQCAQRTASRLGFDRSVPGKQRPAGFSVTTDTNHRTGVYDGLHVAILSDTSHLVTWVTASPYTAMARGASKSGRLLPSRRAIRAASEVERLCHAAVADRF